MTQKTTITYFNKLKFWVINYYCRRWIELEATVSTAFKNCFPPRKKNKLLKLLRRLNRRAKANLQLQRHLFLGLLTGQCIRPHTNRWVEITTSCSNKCGAFITKWKSIFTLKFRTNIPTTSTPKIPNRLYTNELSKWQRSAKYGSRKSGNRS